MYLGFDNGLSYFQPCSIPEKIWNSDYPEDDDDACDVQDRVDWYDPRCRPWYQDAIKPGNQDFLARVREPYDSKNPGFIYVTVSQLVELVDKRGKKTQAVAAIDINMTHKYFDGMISKNLKNGTFDSYFLATKGQSVILSNTETQVTQIQRVSQFLIPEDFPDLRDEFEQEYNGTLKDLREAKAITFKNGKKNS